MKKHETYRIETERRSLYRTVRKLFPNVTREQLTELINATEGLIDIEDLYERITWRDPFRIDRHMRKELSTCVDTAGLHLKHAAHNRDGDYPSMAAYASYLSAEEVSKGLSSLLTGQSRESQRGHRQGRKLYEPMSLDQNRDILKALAPFLNSTGYDSALARLDEVPVMIDYYEKAEQGFGVHMNAAFLRSTSDAFWNFGESVMDVQVGERELKYIVVKLKSVNAPDVFTPELVVKTQKAMLRYVRMFTDQMYLLLVLEPHKNVSRYVVNGMSPLSYMPTSSTKALEIGLLECFDEVWRLQKRFLGDLRYMVEHEGVTAEDR